MPKKQQQSKPQHRATVSDEEAVNDEKVEDTLATSNSTTANAWLVDSGASSHGPPTKSISLGTVGLMHQNEYVLEMGGYGSREYQTENVIQSQLTICYNA